MEKKGSTGTKTKARGGGTQSIEQMANELRPIFNRLSRKLRREAVSAGISSLDLFILGMARIQPGIGISELAVMEDMTRPSMSSHVKRLREAGWLDADESHSDDKRRINLILTDEGRAALARVRERSNDWLAQQLTLLDDEQREKLKEALPSLTRISTRQRK